MTPLMIIIHLTCWFVCLPFLNIGPQTLAFFPQQMSSLWNLVCLHKYLRNKWDGVSEFHQEPAGAYVNHNQKLYGGNDLQPPMGGDCEWVSSVDEDAEAQRT